MPVNILATLQETDNTEKLNAIENKSASTPVEIQSNIEDNVITKQKISINWSSLVIAMVVFLLLTIIYVLPVILKLLINTSTYEEEKERMEHNFLTQKEADIVAYREKYQSYALAFNDGNIKMESIKHLWELSKEYHKFLENIQKETFDFIDKLTKMNHNNNVLLEECKTKVEEQFKLTLEKMSKVFGSI